MRFGPENREQTSWKQQSYLAFWQNVFAILGLPRPGDSHVSTARVAAIRRIRPDPNVPDSTRSTREFHNIRPAIPKRRKKIAPGSLSLQIFQTITPFLFGSQAGKPVLLAQSDILKGNTL